MICEWLFLWESLGPSEGLSVLAVLGAAMTAVAMPHVERADNLKPEECWCWRTGPRQIR